MEPLDQNWKFARRGRSDEFDNIEGGFGDSMAGEEGETDLPEADLSEEEESQEIDFDDPDFSRGEGIWKNYAEDLGIEE